MKSLKLSGITRNPWFHIFLVTYIYECVWLLVCVLLYMCVCDVHVCVCVCIWVCLYVCMGVYVCVCAYVSFSVPFCLLVTISKLTFTNWYFQKKASVIIPTAAWNLHNIIRNDNILIIKKILLLIINKFWMLRKTRIKVTYKFIGSHILTQFHIFHTFLRALRVFL